MGSFMNGVIFIAARILGPLFLIIAVPLALYWIFSGSGEKQSENMIKAKAHDRAEMAQGCGTGCLIGLISLGFVGAVAYKLFRMI